MTLAEPPQPPGELPPPPPGYALLQPAEQGVSSRYTVTSTDPADPVVQMQVFRGAASQIKVLASAPFGWWPAVVLALVALIDRLEQSVLAGSLSSIQAEFGISDTAAGALATGAGIAGLLLVIPSGYIADRVNRTKAVAVILLLWSVLSLGSGLAANFAILLSFRVILGGASVLNNPMAGSLIGDFYPRSGRAKAYGIERLAYYLGNPIGIIVGGIVAEVFGWRWVFLGLVLPGILISILVFFLKEPLRGSADRIDIARAELTGQGVPLEDTSKQDADSVNLLSGSIWRGMAGLLKVKSLRAVYISQGILLFGLGGLFFWTPTFFQRSFGLEEGAAAGISGGMGLLGILAGFSVGIRLGDRYQGIRPGWRVMLGSIGLSIGAVGVLVLSVAPALPVAILAYIVLNFGFSLSLPVFTAALADLSGASRRGLAFSLNTLVISLTSAIGPLLIGSVSDITGDLRYAFGALSIPIAIAAVVGFSARRTYDADAADALQDAAA